jgi:hypothetical protein
MYQPGSMIGINAKQSKPKLTSVPKKTQYAILADTYFLPPVRSTGLSKKYLDKVEQGSVFRVQNSEIQMFLAGLKPSHMTRAAFTSKSVAYSKIDRLLRECGEPGLGFEEGLLPDGDWLYKVARFVDRANLAELFTTALPVPKPLDCDSAKIEACKRAVEQDLLIDSRLDDLECVQEVVAALQASQQRFMSRKIELEYLMVYGKQLTSQVEEDKREMEQRLVEATMTVYCAGEGKRPGEVLQEDSSKLQEVHKR